MKVATLKVLLFVALLAVPTCSRLLTEGTPVEEAPVDNANPNPDNQTPPVEKQEEVVENKDAEVKAPENVEAKPEAKAAEEVKTQAPATADPTPAAAPEKKRSNVGLFILIGVSVLGVIAIGTTFILGKQKH